MLHARDEYGMAWIKASAPGRPQRLHERSGMTAVDEPIAEQTPARVKLRFAPEGGEVRVPGGHDGVRRRVLERHRDRLHLRRPRHLQEVQRQDHRRQRPGRAPRRPRAFTPDELRDGWRLACRASANEDLEVDVPPLQTRPKAALVGVGRHVILRPAVIKRYLELDEPTLEDQVSDLERVRAAIDDFELQVELDVVRDARRRRSATRTGRSRR